MPSDLRYRAIVDALRTQLGPSHFTEPTPSVRAVRYRAARQRGSAPLADLYVPKRPTGASVVLVHGGGFLVGTRDMKAMRFLASRLGDAGIAAFSVDYRMILRGGRLEESLQDVRDALSFWRAEAPKHDLDPNRVSLLGLSAGGTLALLAAAREPWVRSLVCGFGVYELDHVRGGLASIVPRLLLRSSDPAVWRARSPREAAQPPQPTLLLHGTADGLVPVAQAERLAAHRESLGLPTKLAIWQEAPHAFFNVPGRACEEGAKAIIAHVA